MEARNLTVSANSNIDHEVLQLLKQLAATFIALEKQNNHEQREGEGKEDG
ncbi:MAG: hypothetical protein QXU81_00025 [Candidatus Bathyarchaeia archaeon]